MSKVGTWFWDWVWHSSGVAEKAKIDSPLGVITKALPLLATVFGADLLKLVAPGVPASRITVLRIILAAIFVFAAHRILTAKEVDQASGQYQFPEAERWLARAVMIGLVIFGAVNYWPQPKACRLQATLELPAQTNPLYILLQTSGREEGRYSFRPGSGIALQIEPSDLDDWSLALVWPDGKLSKFGPFAGCKKGTGIVSDDARAKLILEAP